MTSGAVRFTFPDFDDIVRIPREDGGVDIMLDGKIIDTIEPVRRVPTDEEIEEHLQKLDELARIISSQWNDKTISAIEAVQEQRRNLTPDEWVSPDEHIHS